MAVSNEMGEKEPAGAFAVSLAKLDVGKKLVSISGCDEVVALLELDNSGEDITLLCDCTAEKLFPV